MATKRFTLVTGGASFIGSHLVERLVAEGHTVRVADDLSSGRRENLASVIDQIEFLKMDLRSETAASEATRDVANVFHLAADHGGRGYIDSYPGNVALNTLLDAVVFRASIHNGVDHITFASSACIYPTQLQMNSDPTKTVLLREESVNPHSPIGATPDGAYGWAKLTGEVTLAALQRQHGVGAVSVRIFSAYGARENTSHAVMAMIARAVARQEPFEIWGDGTQRRNFTHVSDIIKILVAASQRIDDGSSINAGLERTFTIQDTAESINAALGNHPTYLHRPESPVGILSRAASSALGAAVLGFTPQMGLSQGLPSTISWFTEHHSQQQAAALLDSLLSRALPS